MVTTIVGVTIHITYTIPESTNLKANLMLKEYYERQISAKDAQIKQSNEEALIKYMNSYFTEAELREILDKHIKYEIKVNGERITPANANYNITQNEAIIEITATFSDEVYPVKLFTEICPLKICPEGKEIKEIVTIHTTTSAYEFKAENSQSRHKYTYTVHDIDPGEIITLQFNEPAIRQAITPSISKLEVIRTK